jgi:hypothetical protein
MEEEKGLGKISTKTWFFIAGIAIAVIFAFFVGKQSGNQEVIYMDKPNAYVDSVLAASKAKFDSVVINSNRAIESRDSSIKELQRAHRLELKLQKVRYERFNKMSADSITELWIYKFDSARFARARRTN